MKVIYVGKIVRKSSCQCRLPNWRERRWYVLDNQRYCYKLTLLFFAFAKLSLGLPPFVCKQKKLQTLIKMIFLSPINLTNNRNYFCRAANLWRTSQTLPSTFDLLVLSRFMGATAALIVRISSLMALGAALLAPLKVRSTCKLAGTAIFFVTAILKVTVITSTRERCE